MNKAYDKTDWDFLKAILPSCRLLHFSSSYALSNIELTIQENRLHENYNETHMYSSISPPIY